MTSWGQSAATEADGVISALQEVCVHSGRLQTQRRTSRAFAETLELARLDGHAWLVLSFQWAVLLVLTYVLCQKNEGDFEDVLECTHVLSCDQT